MIFFARSEIARSMMSATAMIEAARRNQIGQPAACSIANNRVPYFSDSARGLYGKGALARKLTRRSKNASRLNHRLEGVVESAISTRNCGQVCGLSKYRGHSAPHAGCAVGRDQKLSRFLVRRNMPLAERIGLRRQRIPVLNAWAAYVDSV